MGYRYTHFACTLLLFISFLFLVSARFVRAKPDDTATSSAITDLRSWADQPSDGSEGRPFPLTGSWNIGRYYQVPWETGEGFAEPQSWDPTYFTELIEQGHHVLPTFPDPMTRQEDPGQLISLLDVDFVPAVKFLAKHDLPFAFRDWNWADKIASYENKLDRSVPVEESLQFIKNGNRTGNASPIGNIDLWREFGRKWGSNSYNEAMAEIYPDPPLIVFLNNNEAGEIDKKNLNEDATRFIEKYGQDVSDSRKHEILHKGYRKRYRATFEAAREAAPADWSSAMTFVAYNAFPWPKLSGKTALQVEEGRLPGEFHEWSYFEGAMPENYMNDWQVGRGKTDFSCWSPQTEATTYAPMADAVLRENPDYYFASIGWEGGVPAGRRNPANRYSTGGFGGGAVQKWDFDRYEGMLQFGLWAMRPRVFREFRGGQTRDAYYQKTWEVYLEIVDRVWETEALHPFWKHGSLVESEVKWQPGNAEHMKLARWYLLHSNENPPPSEWPQIWKQETKELRVFALALKLGEAPERRWMVYAHAPLGAVRNAHVKLPDFGDLTLDTVTRSGSFYIVNERDGSVEQVLRGEPPRINLSASHRYAPSGSNVTLKPEVTCPPEASWTEFRWSRNRGSDVHRSDDLNDLSITLEESGKHTFRVTGTTNDGTTVTGETTVWVGTPPADSVVYDVPLNDASTWSGPWQAIGTEWPGTLQRYRLVPNRGHVPDMVLHGGTFVRDAERGRVLQLFGAPNGLCGVRSKQTSNHKKGHPNMTVSVTFKAKQIDGTQVLYVQGGRNKGFNIYIRKGTLYAGSMSGKLDWGDHSNQKNGNNGHWLSTEEVSAGRWHRVTLVLEEGTSQVENGKLSLYFDGEHVATGPGARIPRHHAAPRVGIARKTTLHTGKNMSDVGFLGRIARFRQVNAAEPPGK